MKRSFNEVRTTDSTPDPEKDAESGKSSGTTSESFSQSVEQSSKRRRILPLTDIMAQLRELEGSSTQRYDVRLWMNLMETAHYEGGDDLQYIRAVLDAFLRVFPCAAAQWTYYIALELSAGNYERSAQLFEQCHRDCLDPSLYQVFLDLSMRRIERELVAESKGDVRRVFYTESYRKLPLGGLVTVQQSEVYRSKLVEAYEYSLKRVGQDMGAAPVWNRYLTFLEHLFPDESGRIVSRGDLKKSARVWTVRHVFHRCVQLPIDGVDAIWQRYVQWEHDKAKFGVGVPVLIQKFKPKHEIAMHVWSERTKHRRGIFPHILSRPGFSDPLWQDRHYDQLNAWKRLIEFEKSNLQDLDKEQLLARMQFTFRQALVPLRHFADFWLLYADFQQQYVGPQRADLIYRTAIGCIPDCALLKLLYAEFLEKNDRVEDCDTFYKSVLFPLETTEQKTDSTLGTDTAVHSRSMESTTTPTVEATCVPMTDSSSAARSSLSVGKSPKTPISATTTASTTSTLTNSTATAATVVSISSSSSHSMPSDSTLTPISPLSTRQTDDLKVAQKRIGDPLLFVKYLYFLRRVRGVEAPRQFYMAQRKLRMFHLTIAQSKIEAHLNHRLDAALRIMDNGYTQFSHVAEFVIEYLRFLMTHFVATHSHQINRVFNATMTKIAAVHPRVEGMTLVAAVASVCGDVAKVPTSAVPVSVSSQTASLSAAVDGDSGVGVEVAAESVSGSIVCNERTAVELWQLYVKWQGICSLNLANTLEGEAYRNESLRLTREHRLALTIDRLGFGSLSPVCARYKDIILRAAAKRKLDVLKYEKLKDKRRIAEDLDMEMIIDTDQDFEREVVCPDTDRLLACRPGIRFLKRKGDAHSAAFDEGSVPETVAELLKVLPKPAQTQVFVTPSVAPSVVNAHRLVDFLKAETTVD